MSRCQSTPGLVESQGRVPLEEMWIAPIDLKSAQVYSTAHSLFSPSPSPVTSRGVTVGAVTDGNNVPRGAESPISATSSGPSSEEQTARAAQLAVTQPSTGRQSTHSGEPPFSRYSLSVSFLSACITAKNDHDSTRRECRMRYHVGIMFSSRIAIRSINPPLFSRQHVGW